MGRVQEVLLENEKSWVRYMILLGSSEGRGKCASRREGHLGRRRKGGLGWEVPCQGHQCPHYPGLRPS